MIQETIIQMRFADVDRLGHVNNVNLMHYFDLGKNEYFKSIIGKLIVSYDRESLIIAAINASYLEQIKPDENIAVRTSLEKLGNKSLTLFQQIVNLDTGSVKTECRTVMVAFDFIEQKSIPIPCNWRSVLEGQV